MNCSAALHSPLPAGLGCIQTIHTHICSGPTQFLQPYIVGTSSHFSMEYESYLGPRGVSPPRPQHFSPMAAAAHPSSLYESFIKCHKQRFLAAVHVARRERKHRQPHICIPGLCWVVCKKGQQRDVGRGWHCMLVALKTAALQMPFTPWGLQEGSCTPFTWDTMKCKGLPALPQHPGTGTVMLPPPSHYPAHLAAYLPTQCSPCKQAEGETEAALGGHGVSLQQSRLPISAVASRAVTAQGNV